MKREKKSGLIKYKGRPSGYPVSIPYDKIVANVNKTRVRDQEEKNKIFTMC